MNWIDIYRSRVTTAEEAVKDIRSGDRVWIHPGCNTPKRLDRRHGRSARPSSRTSRWCTS